MKAGPLKSIKALSEDHRIIYRALEILREISWRAQRDHTMVPDDVQKLVSFLKTFADEAHQVKEESLLFPVILEAGERGRIGPVHAMLFEHNQERSLVEGMEEALFTAHVDDFVYFANRLVEILSSHMHKEERILFELIERILTPDEDERVAASFARFDQEKAARMEHEMAVLRELEWRYLSKAADTAGQHSGS